MVGVSRNAMDSGKSFDVARSCERGQVEAVDRKRTVWSGTYMKPAMFPW